MLARSRRVRGSPFRPLGVLHAGCIPASSASTLAGDLVFGLLVAVGDHAVQQRTWLALVVAFGLGLVDFSGQVGGCLFIMALVVGVVLVEVLGCGRDVSGGSESIAEGRRELLEAGHGVGIVFVQSALSLKAHTVATTAGGVHSRSGSLWENRRLIFARIFSTVEDMVVS